MEDFSPIAKLNPYIQSSPSDQRDVSNRRRGCALGRLETGHQRDNTARRVRLAREKRVEGTDRKMETVAHVINLSWRPMRLLDPAQSALANQLLQI